MSAESVITWQLYPEGELRTGLPMTIVAHSNDALEANDPRLHVELSALSPSSTLKAPLQLPLSPTGPKTWASEFTVMLPGSYQLRSGREQRVLQVEQQRYLDFSLEFGLFSAVVLLVIGGMLVWLKKKSSQNVA